MKSYDLFPTIPLRQLVFSVGDINRSRVTHPRVSMPFSVEKPNKLIQNGANFLVSVINVSYIFHFYHLILVAFLICNITATSLTLQRPVFPEDIPYIRELKQRRRRRQQERQKSNWFRLANNNFARASRFFVHFFAVTALLRRENAAYSHVL